MQELTIVDDIENEGVLAAKVTVFITRKGKLRAQIEEVSCHAFEVTIGGKEWNEGNRF